MHAGVRRIHGGQEPLPDRKRERPHARGQHAHPVGVRARGSEAARNHVTVLDVWVDHLAHEDDLLLINDDLLLYCMLKKQKASLLQIREFI